MLEEFIEGDTLGFLLEEALFTPKETRRIVRQLCRALWAPHSIGAVHVGDGCGTGVLLENFETDLSLSFPATRFAGNGMDIDNRCGQALDITEAVFQ